MVLQEAPESDQAESAPAEMGGADPDDEKSVVEDLEKLRESLADLPVQFVFKASFDKANRTSLKAERGPGLDEGLKMLSAIGDATGLPTTTDVHLPAQASAVTMVAMPTKFVKVPRAWALSSIPSLPSRFDQSWAPSSLSMSSIWRDSAAI